MDINIFKTTPAEWITREDYFLELLNDHKIWNQIPLLNNENIQHLEKSTLVRYRGMVQDMHGPELYLDKFDILNERTNEKRQATTRYCDEIETNEDESIDWNGSTKVFAERHRYNVISVPGMNKWSHVTKSNKKDQIHLSSESNSKKRSHEVPMETEADSASIENTPKKPSHHSSDKNENKKSINLLEMTQLCFPLPSETYQLVHIKVYKNQEELKLNDVCEFVGFLCMNDITVRGAVDDENTMEYQTLHPPSSLVPRIHCVSYRKLMHTNPLVVNENETIDPTQFISIYKNLLLVLTQLFFGDELAAEYMIFHLISKVYMRPNFSPLGKVGLNISNVPQLDIDYVEKIYDFIKLITVKSHYLPLTLSNLNKLKFIPKKNNESNSLNSGMLQLSDNTHLVLDETKMNPGKLEAVGINNLKAINNAIRYQKIGYDFNFHNIEFDCDICFLILSEGKSMLCSDFHVVLEPDPVCSKTIKEIFDAAHQFLKADILHDIRRYLTLARQIEYKLTDELEKLVTGEFVNMRQQGAVSAEDFHNLLVLSRYVAISHGKTTLDEESWKKACKLELQRKGRLQKMELEKKN